MLRTAKHHGQTPEQAKPWSLVVFSVGGKRLAFRTEEVGGVWPWSEAMPVPSLTPYINAVVRRGEEILPVFDLARLLMVQVSQKPPLCLVARRQDGPMAICIDPSVPTLHTIDAQAVRPAPPDSTGIIGLCSVGTEEVPIYSWAGLGRTPSDQAREVA
jgi:chemotaxis signal transduction protein